MNMVSKTLGMLVSLTIFLSITGCTPEVGSEKWCAKLEEKPKGDWTANELADFTKHCLLK